MRRFSMYAVALAFALLSQHVAAQDVWPSRPIRLLVVYGAGGTGDLVARAVANQLSKDLKQPVVVENKPGASGMIGAEACKNAKPDGYSFCVFLSDVVTTNPTLFKSVPYNAEKDFIPVALLVDLFQVVATSSKTGIKDIKGLVERAKQDPAGTNFGSWGVGSTGHLLASFIEKSSNTQLTHVPYQTTPALIKATLTNEVTAALASYWLVAGYVEQEHTMRAIAVMGDKRVAFLPDVQTLEEQGIPLNANLWYGLFAPAGTPMKIVNDMNVAVNKALEKSMAEKAIDAKTASLRLTTPPAFAEVIVKESVAWRDVVRRSGIKLD